MMKAPRILAFAGSARTESYNKRILRIAVEGARQVGADVTQIDLRDYPLPIFDEDLEREQGTPQNAVQLKQLFLAHQGLLIAAPEYNSSITPLLKNTIDWVSRQGADEPRLLAYRGKVATLLSASPGALGGLRGLVHVRAILSNIGVIVLPDQVAVPRAFEAFSAEAQLKDDRQHQSILALGRELAEFLLKLQAD